MPCKRGTPTTAQYADNTPAGITLALAEVVTNIAPKAENDAAKQEDDDSKAPRP
jgi:hypothetical protein